MSYDVIVVGARCAGSPTAMLLARKGYKVLLVDKASFPSDTLSTHMIHPPGVDALKRWGLLDRVIATNCPAITRYMFDLGPTYLEGNPSPADMPPAYGPRRIVLDKILVDAAAESGAEIREEFTLDEILFDGDRVTGIKGHDKSGSSHTEHAKVTVGADGRFSKVAEAVHPDAYNERPPILAGYYAYWSNLPAKGFENFGLPKRGCAMFPTNDGLTLLVGGWPMTEFEANKKDAEGNWMKIFGMHPELKERVAGATRETKIYGTYVPNYFRKPYGPGWALAGDAGYNRDFITAMGITDAFLSAEQVAEALDKSLGGAEPYNETMAKYQYERDQRVTPIFHMTCQLATCEPPNEQTRQLFGAMVGNQEQMDAFAQVNSACLSPEKFFSEENIGKIFGAASTRQL